MVVAGDEPWPTLADLVKRGHAVGRAMERARFQVLTVRMAGMERTFQFRLRSIFRATLLVSPLAASAQIVRDELVGGGWSFVPFFNLLACAAAYSGILTMWSRRRALEGGEQAASLILPAARAGVSYGLLFMAQVGVPMVIARAIYSCQRRQIVIFTVADLAYLPWKEMGIIGGMFAVWGVVLGAFGGCITGALLECQRMRQARQGNH